ncbi:MAG: hypothetical protein PHQ41_04035 [Candidatus Cloacimonetes bacterium]|nr:hypothetical protein [Candidatus Cloacimonadota bacterium]
MPAIIGAPAARVSSLTYDAPLDLHSAGVGYNGRIKIHTGTIYDLTSTAYDGIRFSDALSIARRYSTLKIFGGINASYGFDPCDPSRPQDWATLEVRDIVCANVNAIADITGNLITNTVQTSAGDTTTLKTDSMTPSCASTGLKGPILASTTVPDGVVSGSVIRCVISAYTSAAWGIVVKKNGAVVFTGGAGDHDYDLSVEEGNTVEIYAQLYNIIGDQAVTAYIKTGGYTPVVGVVGPTW